MSKSDVVQDEIIPVFWTGGWDSSFRVLHLLFQYGAFVQPIYVIPGQRASTHLEIKAMERIRETLDRSFPNESTRLFSTIVIEEKQLISPEMDRHPYIKITNDFGTGKQYLYLSRVPDVTGFSEIEVSVQSGDNLTLIDFLRNRLVEKTYQCGAKTHVLQAWEPHSDFESGLKIFEKFSFPTYFTDPVEMSKTAEEYGFVDLLDSTWTCHLPFRGEPCGLCRVCIYAIESGKLRRFPDSALRRYKYRAFAKPIYLFIRNPMAVLNRAFEMAGKRWSRGR